MHVSSFGLQMMRGNVQSGTQGANQLDTSARAAIQHSCNFLTAVVGVNVSGWRGMRKAWLSRSTVCTSWCYLVLILAVAEERALRWGIRARKMSAAPETLVHRYLWIGQHIWLCCTEGALSAHHATSNQPIDQPLVVEAYLKICSHQGRVSGGQKGEKCHGQLDSNWWNTTQWYRQTLEEKEPESAAAAGTDCV